ncbi:MAG: deoxyguanosinetriphosphate triphosphohydrolase, partial [Gemella haemolysans]|nr:deoxyguanosinetriphosphate triphosphohydrolase [Gemella haemolysans]
MNTKKNEKEYDKFINTTRQRTSTYKRDRVIEEFYSDKSRIIYSSSFRRLQQKAQVFSLEPNASVRTRLTHSLEVSDLGRTLANKIAYKLNENERLSYENILPLVAIVENACLL